MLLHTAAPNGGEDYNRSGCIDGQSATIWLATGRISLVCPRLVGAISVRSCTAAIALSFIENFVSSNFRYGSMAATLGKVVSGPLCAQWETEALSAKRFCPQHQALLMRS